MLNAALLRLAWRDSVRRPGYTALMVLGVALGVAVVVAIDLANESARRGFTLSTEAVAGKATHVIVGGPSGVPEAVYRQARAEWGLRFATPVVEGYAILVDHDGAGVQLLGIDPIASAPFQTLLPSGMVSQPGFDRFYLDPSAVLLSSRLAERLGAGLGDSLTVQVNDRLASLTVLGILRSPDPSQLAGLDNIILMDVASAQELLGMVGRLSRIDVMATAEVAEGIASRLPLDLRLAPATEQTEATAQLASAFQLNLSALSLLALVVGMFLIYNTVLFSILRRRTVLGILAALGVTPVQVFASVVLEAAVASAVGGVIGIGLGRLLAAATVRLTTQTITDFYFLTTVTGVSLDAGTVLKGIGLGVGAGILGAAAPALEAAGVPPVSAMQRSSLEQRLRQWLPWLTGTGFALGVLGAGLLMLTPRLSANFLGIFAVLLGVALVVPAAVVILVRGISPVLVLLFGGLGRMAARTVVGALSRTSVAIAALMVALAVTIGVSLMISSFRGTVENWLGLTLRADLYVSAPQAGGTRPSAALSRALVDRIAAVPGVQDVETFRAVTVQSEFGAIALSVADARRERDARLYRFADGTPQEVWRQVVDGAVLVSEPFAVRHALPVSGGQVEIATDRGSQIFPVVGVFYDYSSDQGVVLMSDTVYRRFWDDQAISSLGVLTTAGAPVSDVAQGVRRALDGTGLLVQENAAIRDRALAIFDRTFAITAALRLLAVVVAFIGILSALMALLLERRRELATLQALGLEPGDLWRLAFLETGIMGLASGVFAAPIGYALAVILVSIINLRSFGWSLQLASDPWLYIQAIGVGLGAALLAAVYPTWSLGRMSVAEGLRQE